jgi:hypothetical protein
LEPGEVAGGAVPVRLNVGVVPEAIVPNAGFGALGCVTTCCIGGFAVPTALIVAPDVVFAVAADCVDPVALSSRLKLHAQASVMTASKGRWKPYPPGKLRLRELSIVVAVSGTSTVGNPHSQTEVGVARGSLVSVSAPLATS